MGKESDIKEARIGLTVLFSILAFICFSCFFIFKGMRHVVTYDYVSKLEEHIDVEKIIVKKIAEAVGNDIVDENASIPEAIADVAIDKLGVEVDKEKLEQVLEAEDVQESINQYLFSIAPDIMNGSLDTSKIAEGILDLYDENAEIISSITGEEVNSEAMQQIRDTIESVETPILEVPDEISDIVIETEERLSDETIERFEKADEVQERIIQKASKFRGILDKRVIYGVLVLGSLLLGLVIFLNRYFIPTGLKSCGIVCLVCGILNSLGGLIIKLVPTTFNLILNFIFKRFSDFEVLGDALKIVITDVLKSLADKMLLPSLIFMGFGIALLIAAGIVKNIQMNKQETDIS
ncbi:MAG: hypothetical protein K5669_09815 [Lachnospiraceae bacterium]|nr:hypothetical protein [Lachnospiraceae bacterium]